MGRKRPSWRQRRAQAKLLTGGLGLTVLPFFIRTEPVHSALAKLQLIGLGMLTVFGFIMWLQSRSGTDLAARFVSPPGARRAQSRASRVVPACDPDLSTAGAKSQTHSVAPAPKPAQVFEGWSAEVFRSIEWRRFEAVVERLFGQAGFETKSQSHGADGGVDIWLYSKNMPGKPVSIVQCKHWQGKSVGVDKVRELRGVMAAHNIKRGQFATTSTFSTDAQAFGKANGINLLDIAGLLGLIAKRTQEQQAELLAVATEGEYWKPTCVNCGIKLTERKGREGRPFWGCTNYPRCRTTQAFSAGNTPARRRG